MSDQDVFDEELMKELGLDASEIEAVKKDKGVSAPEKSKTSSPKPPPPKPEKPKAPPQKTTPSPEVQNPPQEKKDFKPPEIQSYGEKMTQEIPVQLAAVLGKKSLALGDVINMQLGEVIDFQKAPQDTIDLVANGKLVAKAELVIVDGHVGARIVKLIK